MDEKRLFLNKQHFNVLFFQRFLLIEKQSTLTKQFQL